MDVLRSGVKMVTVTYLTIAHIAKAPQGGEEFLQTHPNQPPSQSANICPFTVDSWRPKISNPTNSCATGNICERLGVQERMKEDSRGLYGYLYIPIPIYIVSYYGATWPKWHALSSTIVALKVSLFHFLFLWFCIHVWVRGCACMCVIIILINQTLLAYI